MQVEFYLTQPQKKTTKMGILCVCSSEVHIVVELSDLMHVPQHSLQYLHMQTSNTCNNLTKLASHSGVHADLFRNQLTFTSYASNPK